MNISTLLREDLENVTNYSDSFHEEQLKDPTLHPTMVYLSEGKLPSQPPR